MGTDMYLDPPDRYTNRNLATTVPELRRTIERLEKENARLKRQHEKDERALLKLARGIK